MKYLLLTFGEYFKLNHDISVSEGYDLNTGNITERQYGMNPKAAKANIVSDSEFDIKLAMPIDLNIEAKYSDLLSGFALVDYYEPVFTEEDEIKQITEIVATGLDANTIDWTLLHYLRVGATMQGLVLWLEEEARTALSDEAVTSLNELGVTIITIDK